METPDETKPARRALVVEDEGMTVLMLRRALIAAGYQVVGAVPDGEQAVLAARELLPDVILMDVNMPGMNGLEATRRILAERPVPIIMITAYSDDALVQEAIDAGACAYLVKPVEGEQITPALRTAMARFEALARLQTENADLKDSMEVRKLVERAKGILMQRTGLSEPDAHRRLQKLARDRSLTLKQVAQEVIQADAVFRSS